MPAEKSTIDTVLEVVEAGELPDDIEALMAPTAPLTAEEIHVVRCWAAATPDHWEVDESNPPYITPPCSSTAHVTVFRCDGSFVICRHVNADPKGEMVEIGRRDAIHEALFDLLCPLDGLAMSDFLTALAP